jgi:hypothetical protein
MDQPKHYDSREAQAKAEVGVTVISRAAAMCALIVFLLTIIAVPAIDQLAGGWRTWGQLRFGGGDVRQRLRGFETALEDGSATARAVRPGVERALALGGASGVANVYLGRDGWLFFEPDVRHATLAREHTIRGKEAARRQRDAVAAIVDLKKQLEARGIALVIVPTPVKPTVQPEMLWPGVKGPLADSSLAEFKAAMEAAGVLVFDPTAAIMDGAERFLASDTHWRPEAMERAAAALADFVARRVALPQSLGVEYRRNEQHLRGRGDLAALLRWPQRRELEEVTIHPVIEPTGQRWSPHAEAEILWLGDSFSNIYSAEAMGWGASAGFAEQFSERLGRPLDALRRNDNGAFATRQMLADELARGADRLAGKRLVIWEFAARELSQGDWRLIELKVGARPGRTLLVPPAGETWIIAGTVTAKGATPRPGNVAYRDHVMAVALENVAVEGRGVTGARAMVYLRSMRDGKLTEAAGLQVGQRIRLRIRDWSEVARQYEFINRSDVPGAEMRGQPVCWGEWWP